MPYNNTPIAPPNEYTGQVNLPHARTKKIIRADPDITNCANNASFAITVATEYFIRHLAKQAHNIVQAERRPPRRNVQYRDIAAAVHKHDNLEFLLDVVPRTITYKSWKDKQERLERKERQSAKAKAKAQVNGTTNAQGKEGPRDGDVRGFMGNGQPIRPVSLDGAASEGEEVQGQGGADEMDEGDETESEGEGEGSAARNGDLGLRSGGVRLEEAVPMEED
ncbi:MAG: hypothetical protein Q9162_000208 [Coniocarpon cinnabarinum]